MRYVFTRAPLDEAMLPQMAHALKTRIDSLSRLKYPAMWEQADRAAAKDTPEKKASREKAAAIRHRLWGIVFSTRYFPGCSGHDGAGQADPPTDRRCDRHTDGTEAAFRQVHLRRGKDDAAV